MLPSYIPECRTRREIDFLKYCSCLELKARAAFADNPYLSTLIYVANITSGDLSKLPKDVRRLWNNAENYYNSVSKGNGIPFNDPRIDTFMKMRSEAVSWINFHYPQYESNVYLKTLNSAWEALDDYGDKDWYCFGKVDVDVFNLSLSCYPEPIRGDFMSLIEKNDFLITDSYLEAKKYLDLRITNVFAGFPLNSNCSEVIGDGFIYSAKDLTKHVRSYFPHAVSVLQISDKPFVIDGDIDVAKSYLDIDSNRIHDIQCESDIGIDPQFKACFLSESELQTLVDCCMKDDRWIVIDLSFDKVRLNDKVVYMDLCADCITHPYPELRKICETNPIYDNIHQTSISGKVGQKVISATLSTGAYVPDTSIDDDDVTAALIGKVSREDLAVKYLGDKIAKALEQGIDNAKSCSLKI